jgi:hypothetical protein
MQKIILNYCSNNNYKDAEKSMNDNNYDIRQINESLLRIFILGDQIDSFNWVIKMCQKQIDNYDENFKIFNPKAYGFGGVSSKFLLRGFKLSITFEKIYFVKWFYNVGFEMLPKNDIIYDDISLLYYLCRHGKLDMTKYFFDMYMNKSKTYSQSIQDLSDNIILNMFKSACHSGNINLVKWIYEINKIIICESDEVSFAWACSSGNLEVAKWLIETRKNITIWNSYAFNNACENGHIDVAKWLYKIGGLNLDNNDNNENAFILACINGHLKLAKWLYSLNVYDIREYNDKAFKGCCENVMDVYDEYQILIASWLTKICKDYYFEIDKNKIINYGIKNIYWKILTCYKNNNTNGIIDFFI